jgi:hypothetical protein
LKRNALNHIGVMGFSKLAFKSIQDGGRCMQPIKHLGIEELLGFLIILDTFLIYSTNFIVKKFNERCFH